MGGTAPGAVPALYSGMKRVLFVVPDLKVGGVQRALIGFLHAAPFDRIDVTLLTFREGGELYSELPDFFSVVLSLRWLVSVI